MGLFNNNTRGSVNVSIKGVEPLREMKCQNSSYSLPEYERKDLTYKKRIRLLRFLSRLLTLLLNSVMISTMSFSLFKYLTTRTTPAAWPRGTVIWPSIMVLAIATITFLLNLATVLSYCCRSVKAANKISSVTSYLGYVFMLVHFLTWAAVAGVFRALRSGRDIWGYTCGATADAVQEQVKSFVDFGKLCMMQEGTWWISIVEAVVYLLSFVVMVMMVRRASHKKKINRIQESMAMESGYSHNEGQGYGIGSADGKKYMPVG